MNIFLNTTFPKQKCFGEWLNKILYNNFFSIFFFFQSLLLDLQERKAAFVDGVFKRQQWGGWEAGLLSALTTTGRKWSLRESRNLEEKVRWYKIQLWIWSSCMADFPEWVVLVATQIPNQLCQQGYRGSQNLKVTKPLQRQCRCMAWGLYTVFQTHQTFLTAACSPPGSRFILAFFLIVFSFSAIGFIQVICICCWYNQYYLAVVFLNIWI